MLYNINTIQEYTVASICLELMQSSNAVTLLKESLQVELLFTTAPLKRSTTCTEEILFYYELKFKYSHEHKWLFPVMLSDVKGILRTKYSDATIKML